MFIVVTGKAQSSDGAGPSGVAPPTGLVYSSDTVLVRVVRLTGVKIIVPATKLVAGEEVEQCGTTCRFHYLSLSLSLPFPLSLPLPLPPLSPFPPLPSLSLSLFPLSLPLLFPLFPLSPSPFPPLISPFPFPPLPSLSLPPLFFRFLCMFKVRMIVRLHSRSPVLFPS